MRVGLSLLTIGLLLVLSRPAAAADLTAPPASITVRGTVVDALKRPLAGVAIELRAADGKIVAHTVTDQHGAFAVHPAAAGVYALIARKKGFKTATLIVSGASGKPLALAMESEQPLTVEVIAALNKARNALSPETGSTVYRFSDKDIDQLPQGDNTPLNQVLAQAPGVSQDAYGQGQSQIHIHGLNGGGIQYRLNGIFLPEAVSSFGQLFSPYFIKSVSLVDNFQPAQFGYRNEGIIDIHTKDGCLDQGGQAEYFGGQRETIQPSFQYGGCEGNLSYYISGFYLQSALGVQAPVPTPTPLHDGTNQGQGLGYFSYLLNPTTRLSLIVGTAENFFQIPGEPNLPVVYPISGVTNYPNSADTSANELEQNYYAVLALQGTVGAKWDYQIAYFSRYYSLTYNPDPVADLAYNGIADRVFHTGFINGVQGDASYRLNERHTLQTGFYLSGETIEEDNHAIVLPVVQGVPGTVPETIVDDFNGYDLVGGIYAQDQWRATEKLEITAGARFDVMDYFTWQYQLSPRLGLVYNLTPETALNAGYARYFQVPPFESVLLETVNAFANTTGASAVASGNDRIKAEDDEFFDVGVTQKLPFGFNASIEGFFMWATNKLDLAQFGNTYIFAPLQYANGRLWGADFSLVKNVRNFSSYFNFSYAVAQAKNIVAGQFLADDPAEVAYVADHWIHLDDAQEFTASSGASYRLAGFLFSVDSMWGNGYWFGFANEEEQQPYLQVNAAIARAFQVPEVGYVVGRVSVINLFDHVYLIRQGSGIGVFAPQYGPRRALYFTLTLPFGKQAAPNQLP